MSGIHPGTYLFAARALRDFGDGFVAILLPVYLHLLGFSPPQVGIIATASLFGSALLTIAVGFLGARHDVRWLVLAAASLMTATGVAISLAHDYWPLLVIAFAGTVNPSAGSVSVFVPLEHAALTREVSDAERTRMFARYSLVPPVRFRPHFRFHRCRGARTIGSRQADVRALRASRVRRRLSLCTHTKAHCQPRNRGDRGARPVTRHRLEARGPVQPRRLRRGFVVQSLLAHWLFERFDLSLAQAGVFFFWSGVLSALSFPVAAWLSRRIGLINTMVPPYRQALP